MEENDMSEIIKNISQMINDGNIPDDIKNIINNFKTDSSSANNSSSNSTNTSNPDIDIGTILKMKSIFEKINSSDDDPRANLLRSLKPYLKDSRKSKVDQYIQLFNMTKIMEILKPDGGDRSK